VTATGSPSGLTASAIFTDAPASPGVAPVNPPCGGFGIDGDLFANTPTTPAAFLNAGDWIQTNSFSGTGCGVLKTDGTPIDPSFTFHYYDAYNSKCDDGFDGGQKFDDNPNNWTWNFGLVSDKQDINNALIHVTKDSNNHTWLVVAADRLSNNGDAYIDFEFLQNELDVITNSPSLCPAAGGGGVFSSSGPNCGRTTNDFLVTLALVQGGTSAGFFVQRWETNSAEHNPSGCGTQHPLFDYFDVTAVVPTTSYFAAVNATTTFVPFGAFGSTTYQVNTFAEAALT
jgi:hypothetical protein